MTSDRHRRPGGRDADAGTTLIEVLIATTLMSVVMAMFTTSVLALQRVARTHQGLSTAQSQLHLTFQRLDAEVRYASSISVEGLVRADWYVEFLNTHSGAPVCTELRFTTTGQLQRRVWAQGATPPGFVSLASGLRATHPFTRHGIAAGDDAGYQQLTVAVRADAGPSRQRDLTVVFTALNSSIGTSDDTTCSEGRDAT